MPSDQPQAEDKGTVDRPEGAVNTADSFDSSEANCMLLSMITSSEDKVRTISLPTHFKHALHFLCDEVYKFHRGFRPSELPQLDAIEQVVLCNLLLEMDALTYSGLETSKPQ